MSEFVKSVLIEVPNESSVVLRTGGFEPVVEYRGGADFSEWIREVYIVGPLFKYNDDMIIEFISSSGVSVERSDGERASVSSKNGLFTFTFSDYTSLYMYIDTSRYEMYVTGVIRIIDVSRTNRMSASPIISAFLESKNHLDNLDNKIYPEWTSTSLINSYIVEMYEEDTDEKVRNFKTIGDGKWYYSVGFNNNDYSELKNGFNKFYNQNTGKNSYIIWRGDNVNKNVSYSTIIKSPATDISYSPAIASYIAAEKLIEEKLSSITNQ